MIDIEKLKQACQQATEHAIKLHDAFDVPYIIEHDGQIVEMLHGKVLKIIAPEADISDANGCLITEDK